MSPSTTTKPSLEALLVPSEFSHFDHISDSATVSRLENWKPITLRSLLDLRDLVRQGNFGEWPLEVQADVVSAVAAFNGEGAWIENETGELARGECSFLRQCISD